MSFTADEIKDAPNKVVGTRQTLKLLDQDSVEAVFLADDAEAKVLSPLIDLCKKKNVSCNYAGSMTELGRLAGIKVGAAAVAILKE